MVFEARYSRLLSIVLIVALVPFVLTGIWITGQVIDMYDPHPLVGWTIAFLSAGAIYIFYTRLGVSGPELRIDASGIQWRKLERPIPWQQLTGVRVIHMRRQPLLCIDLRDPDAYPLASPVARALGRADRALGFGAMGLNVIGLDKSFDELVAAVRCHRPDLFERAL